MSVTYDSTELQNATYIPRYVKHETAPEALIDTIKLARQDGEVIVDDTFAVKYIDIEGILVGSSQADLESKIDAFKELISRKDKNLDISWNSGTRRYVCRAISQIYNRDYYNILHVPYHIRFLVPAGIGKDTSETTALNKSGITATTDTESITFAGSYNPKPRHKVTLTTRGNADVVRIENTGTGDYIDIDLDGFSNGDYLEIDEENQTVKKNGSTNLNYRGKFPSVIIGSNSLKMTVYGSGSAAADQSQTSDAGGNDAIYDNGAVAPIDAQSFVPSRSGRLSMIDLKIGKIGSPGGNAIFIICEDNNNQPGTQVGSAFQIATSSLGSLDWKLLTPASTAPFLVQGRRYWIKNISITGISGSDASNMFIWGFRNLSTAYASGKAIAQKNSATAYVDGIGDSSAGDGVSDGQYDLTFITYLNDGNAASHSIVWQIYYTKRYL